MRDTLGTIVRHIIGEGAEEGLAGIDILSQFDASASEEIAVLKSLNAAFLIALSGKDHSLYDKAHAYLTSHRDGFEEIVDFYTQGLKMVPEEIEAAASKDDIFCEKFNTLLGRINYPSAHTSGTEAIEDIRKVFFPEGVSICQNTREMKEALRNRRKVTITGLNPSPVIDPAKEILITSNVLLTVPSPSRMIDDLDLSEELSTVLKEVMREKQLYWYDHPIQVGVDTDRNEAVYGLRNLAETVGFEKQKGTVSGDSSMSCVLSLSVTHKGLQGIGKQYLEEEFRKTGKFQDLDVYVFTEVETKRLIDEILAPALEHYTGVTAHEEFHDVLGVDGEYGRHYTFLKAISAFWQVCIDKEKKGTFKIDLDQVFPQQELVEQTGLSAFGHMKTPLWGAEGTDSNGEPVELGLLAGALVNEKDIDRSVFVPDVCYPPDLIKGDELIFQSILPQALSTEAEMMTRYDEKDLDGVNACIQRIHVTGGTNGILNHHLRKYRPFTPVFIGRAEDQAYIMSVLFAGKDANLRYVHKNGLIMRHDKEAFAGDAIKAAYVGKLIGDYARILWFSAYARALPWPFEDIKTLLDPFTGCFISRIPLTIVYLRFALKAAVLFAEVDEERTDQILEYMRTGPARLSSIINTLSDDPGSLAKEYSKEQRVWDLYYDVLDHIEKGIRSNDPFALELVEKAQTLVSDCRMKC